MIRTLRIKSKHHLLFLGLLYFGCTSKVQHLANMEQDNLRMDEYYQVEDPTIVSLIEPYKSKIDGIMDEKIGILSAPMEKGKPHSTLTNFMADMILEGAAPYLDQPIDLAIQNYGGVRINSIGKGDITIRNIYELMPFENTLVILEIKGKDLKIILDRIAKYGGWPISTGSSFMIRDSTFASNIIINYEPFDEAKSYVLALPDYVANGGDNVETTTDIIRTDTGILIRDLIIAAIRKRKYIDPDNTIRIKYEQ